MIPFFALIDNSFPSSAKAFYIRKISRISVTLHLNMTRLQIPYHFTVFFFIQVNIIELHCLCRIITSKTELPSPLKSMYTPKVIKTMSTTPIIDFYVFHVLPPSALSAKGTPWIISFFLHLSSGNTSQYSMVPSKRCWNHIQSAGCALINSSIMVAIFCAFTSKSCFYLRFLHNKNAFLHKWYSLCSLHS